VEKRQTYFRYDDTNPEAESTEYIQSLREDVDWLGWKPFQVTFTSDYFDQFYKFAIELIKKDKAYVCHQTKAEMEACRAVAKAKIANPNAEGEIYSPYRNR
jgi:glutaminyl-tRNA synthetase